MRLGRMRNSASWSAARLEVRTSTGRCIGTSAGGVLPVGLPLWRSRNEDSLNDKNTVHLRFNGSNVLTASHHAHLLIHSLKEISLSTDAANEISINNGNE